MTKVTKGADGISLKVTKGHNPKVTKGHIH
jgi:hypothetical protein